MLQDGAYSQNYKKKKMGIKLCVWYLTEIIINRSVRSAESEDNVDGYVWSLLENMV